MQAAEKVDVTLDSAVLKRVVELTQNVKFKKLKNGTIKFSLPWIVTELNGKLLVKMQSSFRKLDDQQADLVDFVKVILETFPKDDKETLFLIICAVNFYRRITEVYGIEKAVHFRDVTNFIIDDMMVKDKEGGSIKTKLQPPKNRFSHVEKLRDIDVSPPLLLGDSQVGLKRFIKDKVEIDKNIHKEGTMKK